MRPWEKEDYLFDLESDYGQEHNLVDEEPEIVCHMARAMARELVRQQAPLDHLVRLDLAGI